METDKGFIKLSSVLPCPLCNLIYMSTIQLTHHIKIDHKEWSLFKVVDDATEQDIPGCQVLEEVEDILESVPYADIEKETVYPVQNNCVNHLEKVPSCEELCLSDTDEEIEVVGRNEYESGASKYDTLATFNIADLDITDSDKDIHASPFDSANETEIKIVSYYSLSSDSSAEDNGWEEGSSDKTENTVPSVTSDIASKECCMLKGCGCNDEANNLSKNDADSNNANEDEAHLEEPYDKGLNVPGPVQVQDTATSSDIIREVTYDKNCVKNNFVERVKKDTTGIPFRDMKDGRKLRSSKIIIANLPSSREWVSEGTFCNAAHTEISAKHAMVEKIRDLRQETMTRQVPAEIKNDGFNYLGDGLTDASDSHAGETHKNSKIIIASLPSSREWVSEGTCYNADHTELSANHTTVENIPELRGQTVTRQVTAEMKNDDLTYLGDSLINAKDSHAEKTHKMTSDYLNTWSSDHLDAQTQLSLQAVLLTTKTEENRCSPSSLNCSTLPELASLDATHEFDNVSGFDLMENDALKNTQSRQYEPLLKDSHDGKSVKETEINQNVENVSETQNSICMREKTQTTECVIPEMTTTEYDRSSRSETVDIHGKSDGSVFVDNSVRSVLTEESCAAQNGLLKENNYTSVHCVAKENSSHLHGSHLDQTLSENITVNQQQCNAQVAATNSSNADIISSLLNYDINMKDAASQELKTRDLDPQNNQGKAETEENMELDTAEDSLINRDDSEKAETPASDWRSSEAPLSKTFDPILSKASSRRPKVNNGKESICVDPKGPGRRKCNGVMFCGAHCCDERTVVKKSPKVAMKEKRGAPKKNIHSLLYNKRPGKNKVTNKMAKTSFKEEGSRVAVPHIHFSRRNNQLTLRSGTVCNRNNQFKCVRGGQKNIQLTTCVIANKRKGNWRKAKRVSEGTVRERGYTCDAETANSGQNGSLEAMPSHLDNVSSKGNQKEDVVFAVPNNPVKRRGRRSVALASGFWRKGVARRNLDVKLIATKESIAIKDDTVLNCTLADSKTLNSLKLKKLEITYQKLNCERDTDNDGSTILPRKNDGPSERDSSFENMYSKGYKCKKCLTDCRSLKEHKCPVQALKPFKCSKCLFACSSKADLVVHAQRCFRKRHTQSVKDHFGNGMGRLKEKVKVNTLCFICQKNFESKFQFVKHVYRDHKESMNSESLKSEMVSILISSEVGSEPKLDLVCKSPVPEKFENPIPEKFKNPIPEKFENAEQRDLLIVSSENAILAESRTNSEHPQILSTEADSNSEATQANSEESFVTNDVSTSVIMSSEGKSVPILARENSEASANTEDSRIVESCASSQDIRISNEVSATSDDGIPAEETKYPEDKEITISKNRIPTEEIAVTEDRIPAKESAITEDGIPAIENASSEGKIPAKESAIAEDGIPAIENASSEVEIPAKESAITEDGIPAIENASSEGKISDKESAITVDGVPAIENASSEGKIPAKESAITEDGIPALENASSEVKIPAKESAITEDGIPAIENANSESKIPAKESAITDDGIPAIENASSEGKIPAKESEITEDGIPAIENTSSEGKIPDEESAILEDEISADSRISVEVNADVEDLTISAEPGTSSQSAKNLTETSDSELEVVNENENNSSSAEVESVFDSQVEQRLHQDIKSKFQKEQMLEIIEHIQKIQKQRSIPVLASPHKCNKCRKTFASKFSLSNHVCMRNTGNPQVCMYCGEKYKTVGFRSHMLECAYMRARKNFQATNDEIIVQTIDDDTASDEDVNESSGEETKVGRGCKVLEFHENTKENFYSCKICSQEFKSREDMRKHRFIHTVKKPLNCSYCGKEFSRRLLLKEHKSLCKERISKVISDINTSEVHISAKEKDIAEDMESSYGDPDQSCHEVSMENSDTEKDSDPASIKIYICMVCRRSYVSRYLLNNHHCTYKALMASDNQQAAKVIMPTKHKCTNCSKAFVSKYTLAYHAQGCRKNAMIIDLTDETASFASSAKPSPHSTTIPLKCSYCKRIYTDKHTLKKHKLECSGVAKRTVTNHTSRSDVVKNPDDKSVNYHLQKLETESQHNVTNEIVFHQCICCSRKFASKYTLKYHLQDCKKKNAHEHQNKADVKELYGVENTNAVNYSNKKNYVERPEQTSETKRDIKCNICDRVFRSYYALYSHRMRAHTSSSQEGKTSNPPIPLSRRPQGIPREECLEKGNEPLAARHTSLQNNNQQSRTANHKESSIQGKETHDFLGFTRSLVCQFCGLDFVDDFNIKLHQSKHRSRQYASLSADRFELRVVIEKLDVSSQNTSPRCKCLFDGRVQSHRSTCKFKSGKHPATAMVDTASSDDLCRTSHLEKHHGNESLMEIQSRRELNGRIDSANESWKQKMLNKRTDLGEKHFVCSTCDRKFASRAQLELHLSKHFAERPYKCLLCEKSFKHKRDAKQHESYHVKRDRGEESEDDYYKGKQEKYLHFELEGNSQVSPNKWKSSNHRSQATQKCEICSKEFYQRHMQQHLINHSKLYLHKCSQCGKAFKYRFTLARHIERKHP